MIMLKNRNSKYDSLPHKSPDMSLKTVRLSWTEIERHCGKLANIIRSSGFLPDVIVGIQRGGCIPAVVLSHFLGVRYFYTLGMRTTTSNDVRAVRQRPTITADLPRRLVSGKKVLLIDDVTNSGSTLSTAKNHMIELNCTDVKSAVVVWDTVNVDCCQADYYAIRADSWVVFPWEKEQRH